jgi:hypothetical protein
VKVSIQEIPLRGRPSDILNDAGNGPRLFETIREAQDWLTQRPGLWLGVKNWQFRFELESEEKEQ